MENLNRNDIIERFREYEITPEEIDEKAARIVMTVRPSMDYEIKGLEHIRGGTLVYSMWEGYKENKNTEQFLASLTKRGAAITTIHTSGHADYYALQKMIAAVSPRELVPIHTAEGKRYQDIFPEANVKQVTNGETVGGQENI
jgi:ribonuclease J